MKTHITKIFLMLAIVLALFVPAKETNSQTAITVSPITPTVDGAKRYDFTIRFSSDSLAHFKTSLMTVLPYADYLATLSFYATSAGVRNFQIRTYLTNFNSTDTTFWTLKQAWDTTGIYLSKPINDTVDIKISGMPMYFLGALIDGKAGNRKDVVIYGSVALYRRE